MSNGVVTLIRGGKNGTYGHVSCIRGKGGGGYGHVSYIHGRNTNLEVGKVTHIRGSALVDTVTAFAGGDASVDPYTIVELDGISTGDVATAVWTQISGTTVTLVGTGANVVFRAPAARATSLAVFRFTVTSTAGSTAFDDTQIQFYGHGGPYKWNGSALVPIPPDTLGQ